jgi:2'-5' RNA ligase
VLPGRAVVESNLHATLALLGSVLERRLGELECGWRAQCRCNYLTQRVFLICVEMTEWSKAQLPGV